MIFLCPWYKVQTPVVSVPKAYLDLAGANLCTFLLDHLPQPWPADLRAARTVSLLLLLLANAQHMALNE